MVVVLVVVVVLHKLHNLVDPAGVVDVVQHLPDLETLQLHILHRKEVVGELDLVVHLKLVVEVVVPEVLELMPQEALLDLEEMGCKF